MKRACGSRGCAAISWSSDAIAVSYCFLSISPRAVRSVSAYALRSFSDSVRGSTMGGGAAWSTAWPWACVLWACACASAGGEAQGEQAGAGHHGERCAHPAILAQRAFSSLRGAARRSRR
jgi:hypothetical protein